MDYCNQQEIQRQGKRFILQCGVCLLSRSRGGDNSSSCQPSRLVVETRSGQAYLKQYGEPAVAPPQPTAEPVRPSTKPPVEKQKETRFSRALQKGIAEGSTAPYRFDVLAQLANIPARTTLYELLRLSKSTREFYKKLWQMLRSS